jgi:hypothetical protein
METPLASYKRIVTEQAPLPDVDFLNLLHKGQAGDEAALRQLSAGCLKSCLEVVEREYPHVDDELRLDLLQEANAAMVATIQSFHGSQASELAQQIERAVIRHLSATMA